MAAGLNWQETGHVFGTEIGSLVEPCEPCEPCEPGEPNRHYCLSATGPNPGSPVP